MVDSPLTVARRGDQIWPVSSPHTRIAVGYDVFAIGEMFDRRHFPFVAGAMFHEVHVRPIESFRYQSCVNLLKDVDLLIPAVNLGHDPDVLLSHKFHRFAYGGDSTGC